MKIIFNLEYQTTFGEELMLNIKKENGETEQYKMTTLDGLHWTTDINTAAKSETFIDYYYSFHIHQFITKFTTLQTIKVFST